MSDIFKWDDKYKIGSDEIDAQHEKLFSLARQLQDDLNKSQLQLVLMNLYQYVREHFKSEETMMVKCNYPHYQEHRQLHDDLLDKLNDHVAEIIVDPQKLLSFRFFLADWVLTHVKDEDQLLADFTKIR